jgi:hypothetical protein
MQSEFQPEDRKVLVSALCDVPDFQAVRERRALIRTALDGRPFSRDLDRVLNWIAWEGGTFVVADDLVRRLEGHEVALGVPALRVVAETIEGMAGIAHRQQLADLRQRLGWTPKPLPFNVERRVGHRRVTISHVSCAPSSNRTCGFPASGSPTIFVRQHAPSPFRVVAWLLGIASSEVCGHCLISRALCAWLDWAGVELSLAGAVRLPFPTLNA